MTRYYVKHNDMDRASSGFRWHWLARLFLWVFFIEDRELYRAYSIVAAPPRQKETP